MTIGQSGAVDAAMSANGTLVYPAGGSGALVSRSLVWVDRQGREETIPAPLRPYRYPRLSPDGTRVAVNSDDAHSVWLDTRWQ